MLHTPFYDPTKSYQENFEQGPFGEFSGQLTVDSEQKGKGKRERGKFRLQGSDFRDQELRSSEGSEHNFLGQKVNAPFGIPAGPLINANFVRAAFAHGFDLCAYKTVRSGEYPCHPYPNVLAVHIDGDLSMQKAQGKLVADEEYREPLSITNSFGVPSKDPDFWQVDMRKALNSAGAGQVLIGSFQGTKRSGGSVRDFIDDHVLTARLVKETGVQVMEINLSCPNEGTSDLLCFDIDRVVHITDAVKNEIGNLPLILKMAYFTEEENLEQFVSEVGGMVAGLSAINTIPAQIVDQRGQQALPGEGRMRSGVCGSAIQWAGLEMVSRLKNLRQKFDHNFSIVGVGGVMEAEDYFTYMEAGADAVMSATGAMWNPFLAQDIKKLKTK